MNTTFIYTLNCPKTGIARYVGKSNDPKRRFSSHLNDSAVTKKTCWIKSLILNGLLPKMEIIDEVDINDWEKKEIQYIKILKACGADLLNMNQGGIGAPPSEETKKKQRKAKFGKKISEATRKKISEKNKGRKLPTHQIKLMSERNKGKVMNEKTRKAFDNQIAGKRRVVSKYDLSGNLIETFNSITKASDKTGVQKHVIIKVCNKTQHYTTANGFVWRFGNNKTIADISLKRKPHNGLRVFQIDEHNNIVNEFNSISEAARSIGVSDGAIKQACRNNSKSKKFYWTRKE